MIYSASFRSVKLKKRRFLQESPLFLTGDEAMNSPESGLLLDCHHDCNQSDNTDSSPDQPLCIRGFV